MSNPSTSEQESLQVQKRTLAQSKIANVQLAALNLTNLDIAASNRRIEAIQRNTLNEAKRQTAVLELQLEETKLAKLEKIRQQQLKQAAFSLNKDIEVLRAYRILPRLIFAKKMNSDVAAVGLTATELHEISDKEYADTVLNKLQEFTISTEKEMSESDKVTVVDFQIGLDDASTLTSQIAAVQNEMLQAEDRCKERKQISAGYSIKRLGYKTALIIFGITFLTYVATLIIGIAFNLSDDFMPIETVFGICGFTAFIICPIWLVGLLVYNTKQKVKTKFDKPKIQQLKNEIQLLEDKIKNLAIRKADLQCKLEAIQRVLSKIINEYPELKNLASAI